jgi:hypothetical protein
MKELAIEEVAPEVETLLEAAQHDRILVTRDGQPFAVVYGVAFKDAEDVGYENSPEFWQMIEERRGQPTRPLAEIMADLFPEVNDARNPKPARRS